MVPGAPGPPGLTTSEPMRWSGRVAGTYMHGFFSDDAQRSAWIERLGGAPSGHDYETGIDETLDRLAEHMAAHLDLDGLLSHAA